MAAPSAITRVWLCLDRDALRASEDDDEAADPDHEDRLQCALARLGELARDEFPNATDWEIAECNDFSPRIEDREGNGVDDEGETITDLCDRAEALAWEVYPAPDDDAS